MAAVKSWEQEGGMVTSEAHDYLPEMAFIWDITRYSTKSPTIYRILKLQDYKVTTKWSDHFPI